MNVLTSQGLELLATTEHGRQITITPPLRTLGGDLCIIYLMGSRTLVPREVPVTPVALKMMIRRVRVNTVDDKLRSSLVRINVGLRSVYLIELDALAALQALVPPIELKTAIS